MSSEQQLEERFIQKLLSLKYEYRADIRDRAALEKNFREKFEALNHVQPDRRRIPTPARRNRHPRRLHRRPHAPRTATASPATTARR